MSTADIAGYVITKEQIEQYLSEVREAIKADRYIIALGPNREDNLELFMDYVLDEKNAKKILMSLKADDFSEILQNEHKGYEHEKLYVFGKDVLLTSRFDDAESMVSLYIKFNKLENSYVIVISFHKQKHPISYYFRNKQEEASD